MLDVPARQDVTMTVQKYTQHIHVLVKRFAHCLLQEQEHSSPFFTTILQNEINQSQCKRTVKSETTQLCQSRSDYLNLKKG